MTAASPADRVLLRAFGGVLLQDSARAGPAAYDSAGRRYVFVPPAPQANPVQTGAGDLSGFAIDVEAKDTPAPLPLKEHLHTQDNALVLRYWTVLETLAKLTDTPVLILLKELGVAALAQLSTDCGEVARANTKIRFERHDTDDLWIVVAKRLSGS